MATPLEVVSNVLPMTYAYDALALAVSSEELGGSLLQDVIVVVGSTILALALGALTLRRRTH